MKTTQAPVVVDYNTTLCQNQCHCVPTTDSTLNDPIVRAHCRGMRSQSIGTPTPTRSTHTVWF